MLSKKEKDFITKEFSADEQDDANEIFILFQKLNSNSRYMFRIIVIGIVIVGIIYIFDYTFIAGLVSVIIALIFIVFHQRKQKDFDEIDILFNSEPDRWVPIAEKLKSIH